MQEGRNFMITDEMLQEASAVVAMEMLRSIPDEPHTFSVRFEKKMRRLLRRARHPVGYRVMRYAAAIILVITVLFGAVFAASPEVRAAVINWVKSAFHEFFKYSAAGTVPSDVEDVEYEYFLPESFDGYTLITTVEELSGKTYLYFNEQGDVLQFSYSHGLNGEGLFIKREDYDAYSDMVGSCVADIYIAKTESQESVIVWQNPNEHVLFTISAVADKDDLMKFAQIVKRTKKE